MNGFVIPEFIQNLDWVLALSHFMEQGGQILWWLAAVVGICWLLVIERVIYLAFYFPKQRKALQRSMVAKGRSSLVACSCNTRWVGVSSAYRTQSESEYDQTLGGDLPHAWFAWNRDGYDFSI